MKSGVGRACRVHQEGTNPVSSLQSCGQPTGSSGGGVRGCVIAVWAYQVLSEPREDLS